MTVSIKTTIATEDRDQALTAGDLKDWLRHIPDDAVIDATGDPGHTRLHAVWEVTTR